MTALPAGDKPVTRDDIEAKLREIRGEVDTTTERAKMPAIAVGCHAMKRGCVSNPAAVKYAFQSIFADTVLMMRSKDPASFVNVSGSEVA